MKRHFLQPFLISCLIFCTYNFTLAQQPTQTTNQDFTVKLLVSVTDEKGQAVNGLTKENFSIVENKELLEIVSAEIIAEPASILILYDGSSSMTSLYNFTDIFRLELLKFIEANLQSHEFLITGFSSSIVQLSDWSNNKDVLENGLEKLDSIQDSVKQQKSVKDKRTTALYDACLFALEKLESSSNKQKIILLVTDLGDDNTSKNKFETLRKKLTKSDVTMYIVSLPHMNFGFGATAQSNLDEMAKLTGGKAFFIVTNEFDSVFQNGLKREIPKSFESMGSLINNRYLLSFKPLNYVNDGKWHKIEAKLNKPKGLKRRFELGYRKGYFASIK